MSNEVLTEEQYMAALYPDRGRKAAALEHLVNKYAFLMKEGWSRDVKQGIALLCENYAQAHGGRLTEDQSTANLPLNVFPTKFAFPLVSQVFPDLVASKLASVQPMNAPIGKVFYKSYLTDTGTTSADTSLTHTGSGAITGELPAPGTVKRARIQFSGLTVTAQKWLMQARWSTEVQEDAQAMAGIDVESDLLKAVAAEILGEIDYTVLSDMVANAAWNVNYVSAPNFTTAQDGTTKVFETQTEAANRLYTAILQASDKVYSSRYVQPNYIIGSPTATESLRKLDSFAIDNGFATNLTAGVRHFGVYAGQYDVYTAPQFPNTNQLLLGVRGEGYIYAPYIAMEVMPGWYDNDSDEWVRNIRTRAARVMTLPQLFSTITIS